MMNVVIITVAVLLGGYLAFSRRLAASTNWQATVTLLAYMVGGAIRFNIRYFEPIENKSHGIVQDTAFLSRIVLVGAYFISITYYLQLLGAFLLRFPQLDVHLDRNVSVQ